jgi:hypothetical protein
MDRAALRRRRWPAKKGTALCTRPADGGQRFEVPLAYLDRHGAVFCELLTLSQEEFGFASGDGRDHPAL